MKSTRKPRLSRAQLMREAKRLVGPEKELSDELVASVRDRVASRHSDAYDSIGKRLVSLDGITRTIDDI